MASIARAGPSQIVAHRTILQRLLPTPGTIEAQRSKADQAPRQPVKKSSEPGYKQDRKKEDRKRFKIPVMQPLSEAQLDHPLFNKNTIGRLELPSFSPNAALKGESIGKAFQISPPGPNALKSFGLPIKTNFEFRVLRNPYTVVRQITQDTAKLLSRAKNESSSENRIIITGRAGSGKSILMLQAVENCVEDGWVVVYIPRGINLVNSTTPYQYNIRTQTYQQPAYSFQLLQRMLLVNKTALETIRLDEDLLLEKQTVRAGTPLTEVIQVAITERTRTTAQAPAILEAVMKALGAQEDRPVLLAVDDFQALYSKTAYRDPHFQTIQPFHLSLPRMIMEFASGKRTFKRGAVLGALSLSQTNYPLSLELRDALELHDADPYPMSPFLKRNKDLLQYAQGLKKLEVPEKLTLEEATGIFEMWKGKNAIGHSSSFYDEMFLGKYTESCGNARDFVWKGLMGTLDV